MFGETNPLHSDVFPDIRTMEAEVVRCVATMFHGDENVCGTVTIIGIPFSFTSSRDLDDLGWNRIIINGL